MSTAQGSLFTPVGTRGPRVQLPLAHPSNPSVSWFPFVPSAFCHDASFLSPVVGLSLRQPPREEVASTRRVGGFPGVASVPDSQWTSVGAFLDTDPLRKSTPLSLSSPVTRVRLSSVPLVLSHRLSHPYSHSPNVHPSWPVRPGSSGVLLQT